MDGAIDLELGISSASLRYPPGNLNSSEDYNETQYLQKLCEAKLSGHEAKYRYGYLSFDVLHKLVLLHHQHELTSHVLDLINGRITHKNQIRKIDGDLHSYRKSMEDYLAWREKDQSWLHTTVVNARKSIGRSFNSKTILRIEEISQPHVDFIPRLKEVFSNHAGLRQPLDVWIQEKRHSVLFSSPVGIPRFMALRWIGGTWSRDGEFVLARNRFAVAVLGGVSLIIPMIVLTLYKDIDISLVIISIAVLVFAFGLAAWPIIHRFLPWVKQWEVLGGGKGSEVFSAKEILLATAAYAAVLVVFIGTNGA